ncbi:MAG TPA: acyl carrier protein, partial [Streptomyces sp.]|nr:acyl carrier protein [Streptomyces sp.]
MPLIQKIDARTRLREIVAAVLELDVAEVTTDASFHQELGVDSLEKIEIATRIEKDFGVSLTSEEAAGMDSVDGAAELVTGRFSAAGGTGL